jgi:hypothetical protein
MLEFTMQRYNELLKRVEQLERSNAPIYFVSNNEYDTITWVGRNTANTAYCTSAERTVRDEIMNSYRWETLLDGPIPEWISSNT